MLLASWFTYLDLLNACINLEASLFNKMSTLNNKYDEQSWSSSNFLFVFISKVYLFKSYNGALHSNISIYIK